jgi:hypothetical protein
MAATANGSTHERRLNMAGVRYDNPCEWYAVKTITFQWLQAAQTIDTWRITTAE